MRDISGGKEEIDEHNTRHKGCVYVSFEEKYMSMRMPLISGNMIVTKGVLRCVQVGSEPSLI